MVVPMAAALDGVVPCERAPTLADAVRVAAAALPDGGTNYDAAPGEVAGLADQVAVFLSGLVVGVVDHQISHKALHIEQGVTIVEPVFPAGVEHHFQHHGSL